MDAKSALESLQPCTTYFFLHRILVRSQMMYRNFVFVCSVLFFGALWLAPIGCSNDGDKEKTNQEKVIEDGGNTEKPATDDPGTGDKTTSNWTPPAGHAAIELVVDDTANKTYKDKQLVWNGSFVYDKDKNTVEYASAWQPTDGPFPPLYDDGPIDKGGHEPVGATAGDNIFGIVVYVKSDSEKDIEFEYGVINEDNNWIWEGSNGTVKIPKGSTDIIRAKGMSIPKHGSINVKITMDTSKLTGSFKPSDPSKLPNIYLKGTMTNWGHIQIQDKGSRGDDKADDGIVTYVQKEYLDYSPHMGLLQFKRHMQFVFQFTSINGREYKDDDDKAIKEGVQAWADCNNDGNWVEQTIIWEKDSRGAVQNTTIIVCDGQTDPPCSKDLCSEDRCKSHPACQGTGNCKNDSDCGQDEECDGSTGKCKAKSTTCTKADCGEARCQNDPVCKCTEDKDCNAGEICEKASGICRAGQRCQNDSECPPNHTCDANNTCIIKPCTSADCKEDRCKNDPICNDPNQAPLLLFVKPSVGPTAGGTKITLSGERFKTGATVTFGTSQATNVNVVSATTIECDSPAGSTGYVDVTVTNTDGKTSTFPRAYRYDDKIASGPTVSTVTPSTGDIKGGESVKVEGANFKSGATVMFGNKAATNVNVVSGTEITCDTPANNAGKVGVTVTNSDGTKDTLIDGYTYVEKNPKADWARIYSSLTLSGSAGANLGPVTCQVYDAALNTGSTGATNGLKAEVGYGPKGSQPDTWAAGNWKAMNFVKDVGNNDEYAGTFSIATAGAYNFACRFSVDGGQNWLYADGDAQGTNNGYAPADAGEVTIIDSSTLSLVGVEPAFGLAKGGNVITLKGGGFQSGITVTIDGNAGTNVNVISKTELQVTTPAGSVGAKKNISISYQGTNKTLTGAFTYTGDAAKIGWCKLQWPPTMPNTQGGVAAPTAGNPSPTVYGQVWKDQVTNQQGVGQGIVGQVGYGPVGTNPATDPAWRWFPMTFNVDKGNNDEFSGSFTPDKKGTFHYAVRFSDDNGVNFWYCDTDGNTPPATFNSSKAGSATVQ